MYDFSRMKQDGTECSLLSGDLSHACKKHFTSVAPQQASTVGHQQPKEHTTTTSSTSSTSSKQRTYPAHMYDFSRMKDGTECHLLRTVDADMAYACEKHFQMSPGTPISVARQQTSNRHRKEHKPYKRTGSKLPLLARNDSVPRTVAPKLPTTTPHFRHPPLSAQPESELPITILHHRHTPPSARPESELPISILQGTRPEIQTIQENRQQTATVGWERPGTPPTTLVAAPASATDAGVPLPNYKPTAQDLRKMTRINGWKSGCLPDPDQLHNACVDCPDDNIRYECTGILANIANNAKTPKP